MPKIKVLPHAELAPSGANIEVSKGTSVCSGLLDNGIDIEHACELSCACTTCHVVVRKGYASMTTPSDNEEDYLDRAWGVEPDSRLSCQAIVGDEDLEIEIPRYTVNIVSERHG